MNTRILAAVLLAAWCALSAAQESVYESKDKAGAVFSDQPTPGAQPVDLPPPNLMQSVTPQQAAPSPAAPLPYTTLAITSPANGGTIHSNTGKFDVTLNISPALRADAGDRIKVKLDGNLLGSSYQSAGFTITAADWQGAANDDNVEHTLQAVIMDGTGAVQIESAAISFYAHRTTVHEQREH